MYQGCESLSVKVPSQLSVQEFLRHFFFKKIEASFLRLFGFLNRYICYTTMLYCCLKHCLLWVVQGTSGIGPTFLILQTKFKKVKIQFFELCRSRCQKYFFFCLELASFDENLQLHFSGSDKILPVQIS